MRDSVQHDFLRSIDDIVEEFKTAKDAGRRNCCLLIGAGCSVSAGIPTATGFVELIKVRHPRAYERAGEKSYAQCMAQLSPSQRRLLITEHVDSAKINWAHVAIALLIKHGFIDRVLTTNFDPLVSRACSLIGEFPAIYDFATSQLLRPADIPDKAVCHLHGQHTGFVLMNTQQDMDDHSQRLGSVFEDAGRGRMWVVVGYSGENDPVFNHLAAVARFDDNLYWVGYKDREAPDHVKEHLLVPGKYAFFTSGYDADSFFIELAQKLEIFPPDFIRKPFSYLDTIMKTLTQFPLDENQQEEDVSLPAKKLINLAIAQYERSPATPYAKWDLSDPRLSNDSIEAYALLMEGDYDAVVGMRGLYDSEPTRDLAEPLALAYLAIGNRLADQAKSEKGEQADSTLVRAGEMYQQSLEIRPDTQFVFYNWGTVLMNRAIDGTGEETQDLLIQAVGKFEQANRINPDSVNVLTNWGNALSRQIKTATGEEADRLLKLASEKFEEALSNDPRNAHALNNLGATLLNHVTKEIGAFDDELFDQAMKNIRHALDIDAEYANARGNLGLGLTIQAKNNSNQEEANQLLETAESAFHKAEKLEPGHYAYALAEVSCLKGDELNTRVWLEKAKESGNLPRKNIVDAESNLDAVRHLEWFKELFEDK